MSVTVLFLFPVVLSLLALAAHFFRAGAAPLVVVMLVVLALLFVRRPWAARVVQVVLVLGSFEWLRTLADLALERVGSGEPVLRLVGILGGVSLVTAVCALVFQTERVAVAYGLRRPGRPGRL
jgi:hypothetical protein